MRTFGGRGKGNIKRNHVTKRKSGSRKKQRQNILLFKAGIVLLVIVTLVAAAYSLSSVRGQNVADVDASQPDIDVQLLDVNPYSRPGTESDGINGIVIHYTANPGSTAQENRDYFNGLQYSHETEASSNFIIGIDGEIIQCVPTWEVAYASNDRNSDTVSIECCHPDESGRFTEQTYRSLVQLTAWLCVKFDLGPEDVIRHYDVTGKICPKYFVENEDAWETFRTDVENAMEK
ncbi:MAG TPA: N-acetylmuramoyl-L-alanine amidase [Candidatus Mediterraneibacter stercoripullorum]|nr:N-acetylmuramoyl-L-alanine amidase [Candidatus Mediterraneibacter stercoripullorum]